MNDYIIYITNEAGVVVMESTDKALLDQDEITVGRTQWIVSSVEEEFDDYYNITRYTIYVY